MELRLADGWFIIELGAGAVAIVLLVAIVGGRVGLTEAIVWEGGGLLLIKLSTGGVGVLGFGAIEGALAPAEKAALLDKKDSTCCSCAAENESNFCSIFSKEGLSTSRWAWSVCFSFPKGSIIV